MADQSQYGLSRYQLKVLMSQRRMDAVNAIDEYGGLGAIASHLETNFKVGISSTPGDVEKRRTEFGANVLEQNAPKWFIELCFDAIQDKTLIILIIAALLSIILGVTVEERKDIAWIEGAAILIAVVIVVFVTALNDWTKERQFRGLQKKLECDARFTVLRDGELVEVPLAEIVVGDVAQFKYGNTFPVDGILVNGFDVKVDEATMTGEADLVKKSRDRDPMLLAGTQVMEGGGTMLVTAVGPHSQQGMIFTLMNQQAEDEGGFITLWLRSIREKLCPRKTSEDGELVLAHKPAEKKDLDVEEKEYIPDEPVIEEPPLTGCAKFNCVKQFKRKKRLKRMKKDVEKRSSGVESSSILQKKLSKLALYIGYGGTLAAVICVLILSLKFAIVEYGIEDRAAMKSDASQFLHFVIIGITVLVVAVPEGLPLAVTIALAFSVKKMLHDHNLVRHLHACETMGNATAVCSDKTGTLTTNRMTVVESFFCGTKYDRSISVNDLPNHLLELVKMNIAVNSGYSSKLLPDTIDESQLKKSCWQQFLSILPISFSNVQLGQGLAKQVGNVTECALLGFLNQLGIDYDAIREVNPTENFVKVFTFNSSRKSMSTVVNLPGGGYRLFTKGASEIVLSKCTHIMRDNGNVSVFTQADKKEIVTSVIQTMASNALRTIGLAYRDFPASTDDIESIPDWDEEDSVVSNLTFLGVVGIQDPVRPEVPHCIKRCQNAGITVRMVTGDNIETARAIALQCGIIQKGDGFTVMEGKEFFKKITDNNEEVIQEKVDKIWPRLRVLARSSPTDKYNLVDGIICSRIHKNREVVAVTGDGTNDGPALKRADVGFAMGVAGTDVAKAASDIILTDDNFASIVKAVMWGRNVYDSISKFLQFQLTVNTVAVVLAITAAISIGDSPLRAIQLLWVNLIMDTFASLALATEKPTEDLLKRKPYGRKKNLISKQMMVYLIGHSIYQLIVLFTILYAGSDLFDIDDGRGRGLRDDPTHHFTIIFNTFVWMQLFNEINARRIHGERNVFDGIWRNWIFIAVMVGQITVQFIIVQWGDIVFSTRDLPLDLWLWCIFLGSTELLIGQLLTFIPVSRLPEIFSPPSEEDEEKEEIDTDSNARLLWVKSLTRLRTQIRVVNAFRAGIEQGSLVNLQQVIATPRSGRYDRPVTGIETAV